MDFQTKGLGFGEVDLANPHIHGSLRNLSPAFPVSREAPIGLGFGKPTMTFRILS